jgi:DNA-binding beta-propeller fold protein YncE
MYLDNGTAVGSLATGGTALGSWGPNVTVWGIADGQGGYSEAFQNAGEALHYRPTLGSAFIGGSPEAGGEAEDSLGQQYVSAVKTNQIEIWAANGAYEVAAISTPATTSGVAVDSVPKRLYVALTASNEVLVYSTVASYKLLKTIK